MAIVKRELRSIWTYKQDTEPVGMKERETWYNTSNYTGWMMTDIGLIPFQMSELNTSIPTISIVSPNPVQTFLTLDQVVNITGIAADETELANITYNIYGATEGAGVAIGKESWAINGLSLEEGQSSLVVTATDDENNTASAVLVIKHSRTNPIVSIQNTQGGIIYGKSGEVFRVFGTVITNADITSVEYEVAGIDNLTGSASYDSGTNQWFFDYTPSVGTSTITVTATDEFGRTVQDVKDFTSDDQLPAIVFTNAPAIRYISADNCIAEGTATDTPAGIDEVQWSIAGPSTDSGAVSVDGNGDFSIPLTGLVVGDYVLTVTAVDHAGNETAINTDIKFETGGPTLTVDQTPTIYTNNNVSTLSGTATDAETDIDRVEFEITNDTLGSGTCSYDNVLDRWEIANFAINVGTSIVTITAYDLSGNSTSKAVTVIRDISGPVITVTAPHSSQYSSEDENIPDIIGNVVDSSPIQSIDYSLEGATTKTWAPTEVQDLGAGTFTITGFTAEPGTTMVKIRARDVAGNETIKDYSVILLITAGFIFDYVGSEIPEGYLECNGQEVSRDTYLSLFHSIGESYGSGDGSTTFNVPDLRGRVTIGIGQGPSLSNRTIGQLGGEENHTVSIAELPAHQHTVWKGYNGGGSGDWSITSQSSNTAGAGDGQQHNNMQPFAVVKKIIKT